MKPTIAISMGDPGGIGPEVILKTLESEGAAHSTPVIFGHESVFSHYSESSLVSAGIAVIDDIADVNPGVVNLINCTSSFSRTDIQPGKIDSSSGKASMESVEAAARACISGTADAMVTAPLSKEAITRAGYRVPGHTEYLADITGTDNVLMMLVSGPFRVALATIHVPLKDVAPALSEGKLESRIRILHRSLVNDFGISEPAIAVLGLNPHAGDGGVIGREEIDTISPLIKKLNRSGLSLHGPFAADGFFGKSLQKAYDAVFAMYHDQGLIPFKALTFGLGVNFTAGLPIIRTSPDHGTAFDIAGKNRADSGSFRSAYKLAIQLSQNRTRSTEVSTR